MDIDFEKLITLQELDNELRSIHHLLEITPQKLNEIDSQIASASQIVKKARDKLLENQKRRRELEREVADLRTRIATYKRQLNDVKTNKEYTALLKEIEEAQKKVDIMEETIISAMLEADDIEKEIEEANQTYAREESRLEKEKEIIIERQKEYEARLRRLEIKKREISALISPEQIALYRRIADKKGGIAISRVTDDFCSMCHMRIRPQMLNELYDMKKIYLCENCGRILYICKEEREEEEGAAEKPARQKKKEAASPHSSTK